jgi:mono/diheme cytochrome c family protein
MKKLTPILFLFVALMFGLLPTFSPAPAQNAPAPSLVAQGGALFQTKICSTCHQVDAKVPAPAGAALKAPAFMGDFWGKPREVQIDADPKQDGFQDSGKTQNVMLDDAYFLESVERPYAKVVKGAIPGMAAMPTTPEERNALLAYVKSLSRRP